MRRLCSCVNQAHGNLPEVDTQWVRAKISPFNSRSTGFCALIFKGRGLLLMAACCWFANSTNLGLTGLIQNHLMDSRTGRNTQFPLADLFRQSSYSRLAGYEDMNDATRLASDPTFRLMGSKKVCERGVALTSTLHWFKTDLLARDENPTGLATLDRELVAWAEGVGPSQGVVLDMDSIVRARCMGSRNRALDEVEIGNSG